MSVWWAQCNAFVRERPYVAGCLVLALVLGGVNYFLWQRREAVTEQHAEARRKGEFMLQALTRRARIDADLGALREAMAQINDNLLEEQSMEVNLGYFYKFERKTRVRLVRLNQLASLPAAGGSRYKAVPFSMQVTGSYRESMSFLRALESGPRILRVRSCTFERGAEDSTDLTLDLTVDVLAKS
jgi:Tfp pilus assembly protein PilO